MVLARRTGAKGDAAAIRRPHAHPGDDAGIATAAVLLVHNAYREPGGEDAVFEEEAALLEARGHEVLRYRAHNDSVAGMGRAALAARTFWNRAAYREIGALVRRHRPAVVHFHNTFPLVSPAGYYATASGGVPVVQTLHNYRLVCPNGLLFRDGRPCEDCLGKKFPWPAVAHGCYRGSRPETAVAAAMVSAHGAVGTWAGKVDAYVAPTEFAREKLVRGGLPPEKVHVKPNFVSPDPGPGDGGGGYALFVGRLSEEKGLGVLLAAWERMGVAAPELRIVGDGPFAPDVARAADSNPRLRRMGRRTPAETRRLMKDAAMLVFPSEVYETFGRVAAESFAAGTPVVASGLGAVAEVVEDGRTGLHFSPGDAGDLARKVMGLLVTPGELLRMRGEARREYELRYTPDRNYRLLAGIYAGAIRKKAV